MDPKEYINKILTEWNPLGVPDYIADVEYIDYVPVIMNNMDNVQSLCSCLEKLLIEKMGGGGHFNSAGVNIKNSTISDVHKNLNKILSLYLNDATSKKGG